jgi:hypothetical protein
LKAAAPNWYQTAYHWLPSLTAGGVAALAFILLGHTPVIRALGLALAIVGVAHTLRRFGGGLALIGSLALAFSPAFWSQTGGSDNATLSLIAIVLLITVIATLVVAWLGHRPALGIAAGLIVFALLFWTLVGTPRSLRLTTFFSAWLLYLLVDMLMAANPRPDGPAATRPSFYHIWGVLLLYALGVLNDPLFTLLTPALVISLLLSKPNAPRWYGIIIVAIALFGVRGIIVQYLDSSWWLFPAEQAQQFSIQVPFVLSDGWRDAGRWLYLFNLVSAQFTIVGILLGVLGLARLARWYPPVGEISLLVYAAYALFGLVYFGKDGAVLLLPLWMIQVIWMTYAVYTFAQWLQKSFRGAGTKIEWAAAVTFGLLPLAMLWRIMHSA